MINTDLAHFLSVNFIFSNFKSFIHVSKSSIHIFLKLGSIVLYYFNILKYNICITLYIKFLFVLIAVFGKRCRYAPRYGNDFYFLLFFWLNIYCVYVSFLSDLSLWIKLLYCLFLFLINTVIIFKNFPVKSKYFKKKGWFGIKFIFNTPIAFFIIPLNVLIQKYIVNNLKTFRTRDDFDQIIKQNASLTKLELYNLLTNRNRTKFYTPSFSLWPILISFSILSGLIYLVLVFHSKFNLKCPKIFFILLLISIISGLFFWFHVFYVERFMGNHVSIIRSNVKLAFCAFIGTEILCFLGLFWVFLHSFLAAGIMTGLHNPGEGVVNFIVNELFTLKYFWDTYVFNTFGSKTMIRVSTLGINVKNSFFPVSAENEISEFRKLNAYSRSFIQLVIHDKGQIISPYGLPLTNTLILLCSAATLNASHVSLKRSNYLKSLVMLSTTILLGLTFMFFQFLEYKGATLKFNDGIYSSCLYSLTGLHGFHVALGICVLLICLVNIAKKNYTAKYHQSYYYGIMYWHFVDVVWLLVYYIMYYWPGAYFFSEGISVEKKRSAFNAGREGTYACLYNLSFGTSQLNLILENQLLYAKRIGIDGYKSGEWGPKSWDGRIELINIIKKNINVINFNLFKKDPQMFATMLTIIHYPLVQEIIKLNIDTLNREKEWPNKYPFFNMILNFSNKYLYYDNWFTKPISCNDPVCPFHKKR